MATCRIFWRRTEMKELEAALQRLAQSVDGNLTILHETQSSVLAQIDFVTGSGEPLRYGFSAPKKYFEIDSTLAERNLFEGLMNFIKVS